MKTKEERPAFKMNLEAILTEAELKACAKELAESLNRKNQIDTEVATFKAQKKAEGATIAAAIERNVLLLNTGREFRMIECDWDYD